MFLAYVSIISLIIFLFVIINMLLLILKSGIIPDLIFYFK